MRKVVQKIDSLFNWQPNHIFYTSIHNCTTLGWFYYTKRTYTKLGSYIASWPLAIFLLLIAAYYIISWPIWAIVFMAWFIISRLFFPRKWLKEEN